MMPLQAGDVPETYANVDDLVRDLDYKPSTSVQKGIDNFVKDFNASNASIFVLSPNTPNK